MSAQETPLQRLFLATYPSAIPALRLFRRNVVLGQTITGARVKAGIKGQADLYGYLAGKPAVPVELELKSSSGKRTPEQVAWAAWCGRMGVPYALLVASRTETPEQTVERWIQETKITLGLWPGRQPSL